MSADTEDRSTRIPAHGELDRPPFATTHKIEKEHNKFHLLLAITGSVAVIKLKELLDMLHNTCKDQLFIKIIATKSAIAFLNTQDFDIEEVIYEDRDEWSMWKGRGDQVLHIELRKWADALLIAPLDANSMAKMALGLSDNLVTSVVRAWDNQKSLYYAPAMNTYMWENPLTFEHRKTLKERLQFKEIPPMEKTLMCGDSGIGAMASVELIVSVVAAEVKSFFAVYSR